VRFPLKAGCRVRFPLKNEKGSTRALAARIGVSQRTSVLTSCDRSAVRVKARKRELSALAIVWDLREYRDPVSAEEYGSADCTVQPTAPSSRSPTNSASLAPRSTAT
jgi:hypothetical protein